MHNQSWRASLPIGVLILVAIATTQLPSSEGGKEEIEKERVLARLVEIQSAAEELDADKLFGFVLENDKGALAQDGEVLLSRRQALEATRQGLNGLRDIAYRFEQQHIQFPAPTVAIAVGEGATTATTEDGREFKTRFAQSVLLVKRDGEWLVYHAHRSFPPAD